ncbi:MAG: hypothetical protein U0930_25430 [Pirellulales bacterium]
MAVPTFELREGSYIVHDVKYCEWQDWSRLEDLKIEAAGQLIPLDPIHIYQHPGSLNIRFVWSWSHCGAPTRRSHQVFQVPINQWSRFTCNGRIGAGSTRGSEWIYHKTIFNIALVEKNYSKDVFTATLPFKEESSLARLR